MRGPGGRGRAARTRRGASRISTGPAADVLPRAQPRDAAHHDSAGSSALGRPPASQAAVPEPCRRGVSHRPDTLAVGAARGVAAVEHARASTCVRTPTPTRTRRRGATFSLREEIRESRARGRPGRAERGLAQTVENPRTPSPASRSGTPRDPACWPPTLWPHRRSAAAARTRCRIWQRASRPPRPDYSARTTRARRCEVRREPRDRERRAPSDHSPTPVRSAALAQEDDDHRPRVQARDRRLNSYLVPDRPIPLARSSARSAARSTARSARGAQ